MPSLPFRIIMIIIIIKSLFKVGYIITYTEKLT